MKTLLASSASTILSTSDVSFQYVTTQSGWLHFSFNLLSANEFEREALCMSFRFNLEIQRGDGNVSETQKELLTLRIESMCPAIMPTHHMTPPCNTERDKSFTSCASPTINEIIIKSKLKDKSFTPAPGTNVGCKKRKARMQLCSQVVIKYSAVSNANNPKSK